MEPRATALTGRLYGRRPGGEACTVELTDRALVADASGDRLEFSLDPGQFGFGGTNDAMLLVQAAGGANQLSLYLPRDAALAALRGGGRPARKVAEGLDAQLAKGRRRGWAIAAAVMALLVAIGFAGYLGTGLLLDWALDRVPPQWEVGLGKSLVGQLAPAEERRDDPELRAAIDPIVERLIAAVGETPYRFEVHLVKSETVNAFALPGGQIAIYTGLIEKSESPEQLAGVLAHEFQHVLRRHSLKKIAEALKWHLLLSFVIGDLSSVHDIMIGHAANLFTLSNDRDAESEADRLGVELLAKASIPPDGMAQFFEILQKQEGSMPEALSFLSTHPGSGERVESIRAQLASMPAVVAQEFAVNWESAREAAREVTKE